MLPEEGIAHTKVETHTIQDSDPQPYVPIGYENCSSPQLRSALTVKYLLTFKIKHDKKNENYLVNPFYIYSMLG